MRRFHARGKPAQIDVRIGEFCHIKRTSGEVPVCILDIDLCTTADPVTDTLSPLSAGLCIRFGSGVFLPWFLVMRQ